MRTPAKVAFSPKYRSYGIWGAFGLVDHGFCEESDMSQTCRRRGEGNSGEGWTELGKGTSWFDGKKGKEGVASEL